MGTINQVVMGESYKNTVLHFFCAFQTSDGEKEKKRRMEVAAESGGFVGNGRNALRAHPGEPERRQAASPGYSGYSGSHAAAGRADKNDKGGRGNPTKIEND